MPYYLVYFTLTQKYYDATPEEQVELPCSLQSKPFGRGS